MNIDELFIEVERDIKIFYFEQETAYNLMPSLVGSEMCIRTRLNAMPFYTALNGVAFTLQCNIRQLLGLAPYFSPTGHGHIIRYRHGQRVKTLLTLKARPDQKCGFLIRKTKIGRRIGGDKSEYHRFLCWF